MSIRITEDTPEPGEDGLYIFHGGDDDIYIEKDTSILNESHACWYDTSGGVFNWKQIRTDYRDDDIESLAAHDARIRREALELSDEEIEVLDNFLDPVTDGVSDDRPLIREGLKAVAERREASDVRA